MINWGHQQDCRICGCTELDCTQCIERTGQACYWYEVDLCSACLGRVIPVSVTCSFKDAAGYPKTLNFDMDLVAGMDEDIQLADKYRTALSQSGFKDCTIDNVNYSIHELD